MPIYADIRSNYILIEDMAYQKWVMGISAFAVWRVVKVEHNLMNLNMVFYTTVIEANTKCVLLLNSYSLLSS